MATYIVSYDLVSNRDYDSLYKALKSFNKWAKVVESTWVIVSDMNCTAVRDALLTHMDDDDRLFVALSSGVGAWRNSICSNAWLKENL